MATATIAPPATLTVDQWDDAWPKFQQADPQTIAHNSQMIRAFVHEFGKRPLSSLEKFEMFTWAAANPGSARYVKTFLFGAVEMDLLDANPLQGFTFHSRGKKDITVLTTEDVERAAAVATETAPAGKGEEFRFQIRLTGYCALRLRESASLTCQHIGAENKYLHIFGKRTHANPSGERKVLVPKFLRADLEEFCSEIGQNVFTTAAGNPHTRQSIGRYWGAVRNELGLTATFHELRHFGITWMVDQGADRQAVSWQCFGHPNSKLVDGLYAHPDRDAALERLAGSIA